MIENPSSQEETWGEFDEMEKNISDVFSLDQEDASLLDRKVPIPGEGAHPDLERLKQKYQDRNRPDLVNVVIAWGDPDSPLHAERLIRTRRKIEALQADDVEAAKEELEWFKTMFGKKD